MRAPINKYTITNLNLRKEPSKSAMIIKVIPVYSRFELIDSDDEWLKVLDPINYSSLGARYKNKRKAFKTIIITGVFRPEVFFDKVINNVKGYDIEPLIQFVRRLIYTCQAVNGRYSLKALTQENMNADFVRIPMSDDCDTDRMANVLTQLIEYNSTDEHERTHKTMTMNDLANMSKALGMNNTLSANE